MNTLELFNDKNLQEYLGEGWRVLPNIDKEKYQERKGLEGPYRTNSGKVVYYDPKEGKYYDPDSDMYMSHDDYEALDEGVKSYLAGALLAGLMGLGAHQVANMTDAKNSPLGKAMAQAAEQGDQYAAKQLDKLDAYFDLNDTGSIKVLSKKYLGKVIEGVVTEQDIATTKKSQRILNMLKQKNPSASNDLEALLLAFEKGQKQDRMDINRLGAENDAEEADIARHDQVLNKLGVTEADQESRKEKIEKSIRQELEKKFGPSKKRQVPSANAEADREDQAKKRQAYGEKLAKQFGYEIAPREISYFLKGVADGKSGNIDRKASDAYGPNVYAYDKGVSVGTTMRKKTNEDYYDTDEQRELARLGRIIMDIGAKRDDDIGAAMGAVGMELTKYGTPQGVNNIQKLEKVTGQPESVIMKMMALAQKVQGDVAVGDDVPDEEEVEEGYDDYLKNKIGRASDEYDVGTNNWEVKVDGKPWKVFRTKASAIKASSTIQMRYGKETAIYATRKPVSEGIAEDFDTNFKKRVGYTVKGGAASDMMKKQAAQAQANNPDAGTGLGPSVLNIAKARKKAADKGVRAPSNLRSSPNTKDPKRLPEAESPMVTYTVPNVTFDMASKLERLAKEKGVEYSRQGRTVVLKGPRIDITSIRTKMGIAQTNIPMEPVNEALDHDIKIGDTVETLKMGQMQGTVTGFSTKYGDTRVMFKHKSGKVYATPASNLKVINSESIEEAKKKPVPTDPSKWSYYKSQAKKKFDVYPSAYANAWAAKQYKAAGGGWRMGKPKK